MSARSTETAVLTTLTGVYAGTVRPLPPDGHATGIYKEPCRGPVQVTALGLAGDEHGDTRVHGGAEKAVHYFPAENYDRIAARLPDLADRLGPGVLGENLSARGVTEGDACLGDIWRVGSCLLQLSQPRNPCWRIDNRLEREGTSLVLTELGCPGWYFRVLEPGVITVGDEVRLADRPGEGLTLARFHAVRAADRPDPGEVRAIAEAPGLNEKVATSWRRRADWLDRHR